MWHVKKYRDAGICFLASLNILIFTFIGLNQEAFQKIRAYEVRPASLSFDEMVVSIQRHISRTSMSSAPVVSIPKISVHAPLVELNSFSSIDEGLRQGIVSLSAFSPTDEKPAIVYGHSSDYPWNQNPFSTVFTLLPKLEIGDSITIQKNQQIYHYRVEKTLITDEHLTGLNQAVKKNDLVLSTCYPIGFFSKRFNVIASAL